MQKAAVGGGVCAVIENKRSHLLPRGGPLWAEPTSDGPHPAGWHWHPLKPGRTVTKWATFPTEHAGFCFLKESIQLL